MTCIGDKFDIRCRNFGFEYAIILGNVLALLPLLSFLAIGCSPVDHGPSSAGDGFGKGATTGSFFCIQLLTNMLPSPLSLLLFCRSMLFVPSIASRRPSVFCTFCGDSSHQCLVLYISIKFQISQRENYI